MKKQALQNSLLVAAISGLIFLSSAKAQIVTNGSFETGASTLDYSIYGGIGLAYNQLPGSGEWSFSNTTGTSAVWTSKSGAFNGDTAGYFGPAQEGSYYVAIQTANDQGGALASINQTLTSLTIGQQYQVNGFIRARDTASLTGTFQLSTTNAGIITSASPLSEASWNSFSAVFTATQVTDTIQLGWSHTANVDQTVLFDNISIVAVPEPAMTWTLALGALISLVAVRRRKEVNSIGF